MARVHYVKAAQKDQGNCLTCGAAIMAGEPYKWAKTRTHRGGMGFKKKWCSKHSPTRAQMTSSQHLATLYQAQDDAADTLAKCDNVDDMQSAMQAAAEGIKEAAEGYRESAQNMEEGFGHATSMSEELEAKADEIEAYADDVEQWTPDDDPPDDDYDPAHMDDYYDHEQAKLDWLDACRESAQSALDESPY
jgi:hypothetical protein